jgi:2-polyprenyl-3-methyl-5-hydroxy-6-metoxy-1,4-benzoquinol methylase
MKATDRLLQRWRLRQGMRWLGDDVRVIDVGAHQGELFQALGPRLREGFGVEPLARTVATTASYALHPGLFPATRPTTTGWDAITMFAVLEHIPRSQQAALAEACHGLLRVGGRVVITVPSKSVDHILAVLRALRLIDGMSLEEHFGFEVEETPAIFAPPRFRLLHHGRFQLGLNHLLVFERL